MRFGNPHRASSEIVRTKYLDYLGRDAIAGNPRKEDGLSGSEPARQQQARINFVLNRSVENYRCSRCRDRAGEQIILDLQGKGLREFGREMAPGFSENAAKISFQFRHGFYRGESRATIQRPYKLKSPRRRRQPPAAPQPDSGEFFVEFDNNIYPLDTKSRGLEALKSKT